MSIAGHVPKEVYEMITFSPPETPEELYGKLAWAGFTEGGEEWWARLSPQEQTAVVRRVVLRWWVGGDEWGQIFLKSVGEEWL